MHHPYIGENFLIKWSSLSIDSIEDDITYALGEAEKRVLEIENISLQKASYANTALGLEEASCELDQAWSIVEHMTNVMDSPELRDVYKRVLPKVTDFYAGICLRPQLWKVVRAMSESKEIHSLDTIRQRHVTELVLDFLECGADLDEQSRTRVKEIDNLLAELTQKYSENVLDSTNDWEMVVDDASVVSGFPEVLREIARENALAKGYGSKDEPKWRFTLHAPSIFPFMKYVEDEVLRKEAWVASCGIGKTGDWDNSKSICEIIKLRHEKAGVLGFDDFSDMVLKRRMARSGANAREFIGKLKNAVGETIHREVGELEQFQMDELGLQESDKVEPWDVAYWSEKMLVKKYAFDDELLRPYFSIDRVLSGLFEIAEKLFGLRLVERETHVCSGGNVDSVEVWTDNVQYYDMYDRDSGLHMGGFYSDWFPRESKRSGAWMDSLKSGVWGEDGKPKEKALGILCGNMTPGSDGKPALLTHGEVETVFHEFGHLIHDLCGEVEVKYLNGISVAWDFVELPSQILENWCWQRESLDVFASHVDTKELIPDELYAKMLSTRNFHKGLATMRQLSLGIMDLDLHMEFCKNETIDESELDSFVEESIKDYKPQWKSPTPSIIRRFGHLFSSGVGYAAGYYSYQWSEVLEADAFGKFLDEGILNPETGKQFRKAVLSVGNSIDPMQAYEQFRGRKPTLEAYLKRADMAVNEESRQEFGVAD